MELKEQPGTIVGNFCFKGIYQDIECVNKSL